MASDLIDTRCEAALRGMASKTPDKAAIAYKDLELSYEALLSWASACAADLMERGLNRGDRVALFSDKSFELVVSLYGVWLAGGVAVPIHDSLRPLQIEHILRDSESRFLITKRRKWRLVSSTEINDVELIEVPARPEETCTVAEIAPETNELGAILYTSGSTGLPKGVALSHENICAGARIVSSYLNLNASDRLLSVPPFSFDYGLNQLTTAIRVGATLFLQRSTLPGDISRSLANHEITVFAGVPPMWLQLLQPHSPLNQAELPHLRAITNTGGVFPVEAIRAYQRMFPHIEIFLMYGLTEAFRSTFLPPSEVDRIPNSIGKAIPECEMLVLDADGQEVGPDEVGELVHRGPTVSLGYWKNPEATAAKFRKDPLDADAERLVVYSGDLVRRDRDGYLYFQGRADSMLKCYGYRVSADEVEKLVYTSGLVSEVIAKGKPHAIAGTVIELYVVPKDADSFEQEALADYCHRELPSYMLPEQIHIRPSFPRTSSGKIDRKKVE